MFRVVNVLISLIWVIFPWTMSFWPSWRTWVWFRMTFIDLSVHFKMLLKMECQYFIFVYSLLIIFIWMLSCQVINFLGLSVPFQMYTWSSNDCYLSFVELFNFLWSVSFHSWSLMVRYTLCCSLSVFLTLPLPC